MQIKYLWDPKLMAHPLATFDTHEHNDDETEIVVHVSECFEIKEELKALEFSWSPGTKTWVKRKSFVRESDADSFIRVMQAKLSRLGCEIE